MKDESPHTRPECGPVVVGGMAGSGTRLVAEILLKAGYNMGSRLNMSLDNLWFTLLFKRPVWYSHNQNSPDAFNEACKVFEQVTRGEKGLNLRQKFFVLGAALDWGLRNGFIPVSIPTPLWRRFYREARWSVRTASSVLWDTTRGSAKDARGWGWKEPNAHVFLEPIGRFFPSMRYVHVIRHGIDMAFSSHRDQFYFWAHVLFTRDFGENAEPTPRNMLRYWVCVNERSLEIAKRVLPGRYFVMNYEDLCQDPVRKVRDLLAFLDAQNVADPGSSFFEMPRVNARTGGYKNRDLSALAGADMEAVEKFGFKV